MPKPCHLLHDDSPTCHICHQFRTSEPHRRLWSDDKRTPKTQAILMEDPPIDCPHRSPEPTGYCGTCKLSNNAAKYDCALFDETVHLYKRKGVRDCSSCQSNPNRISLPLI